eukprot:TRINITY_DN7513_c0_g2_i1.p2 TRINITY_DN7513_c0_g2~~TRINITY_DN7513_c0_g2_i1.p2  ORF type:complete len:194 (-),score=33.90 TRINITY_DN7513_c0_g2_i1:43-624(-)
MLDDLASEPSSVADGRGTRASGQSWLSSTTSWKVSDRSEYFNIFPNVPSNGRHAYVPEEEEESMAFARRFVRRSKRASTTSSSASSFLGTRLSRFASQKDDVQALGGTAGGAEFRDNASEASPNTQTQDPSEHARRRTFFADDSDESDEKVKEQTPQVLGVDDEPQEPVCEKQKNGLAHKLMWWRKLLIRKKS